MQPTARFCVNSQNIVHEIIDGEVVVIDLDTGSYYGADQVGAVIWQILAHGATLGEIISASFRRFAGDPREIEHGVTAFVQRLLDERLIVPDGDGATAVSPAASAASTPVPFRKPRLDRYDDMRDLLLADPIHEIDQSGWPNRRATSPQG